MRVHVPPFPWATPPQLPLNSVAQVLPSILGASRGCSERWSTKSKEYKELKESDDALTKAAIKKIDIARCFMSQMHQTHRRERFGKTLIDRSFAWGNVNFKPNIDLNRSFLFEDATNDKGFSDPVAETGLPSDSDADDEPYAYESDDNADEHFFLHVRGGCNHFCVCFDQCVRMVSPFQFRAHTGFAGGNWFVICWKQTRDADTRPWRI